MFTPLFFRRLLFLIEWVSFGASFAAHGFVNRAGLVVFSMLCGIGVRLIAKYYGEAAEPLIPVVQLPALPKGTRALLLGAVALGVFLGLPPLIRIYYPAFNAFGPDTINAYTLGACQFFTAVTMAYASWRFLFPSLYAYAAETMEGKILESITSDLVAMLPQLGQWDAPQVLASLAERRRIATLTFTVRCTRFVFSVLPFFLFLLLANHALASALTAVPSSVHV